MHKKASGLLVITLALALAACGGGASKTDSGGVILQVGDFTQGLPICVSVSNNTSICPGGSSTTIPTLTIHSILRDPSGTTSSLMNVNLRDLQVTYDRADRGTRVPPPFIMQLPGIVPANGTLVFLGVPVMGTNQFATQPLLDLGNFGIDRETGSQEVVLNVHLTFFGQTLAGKAVQSEPFDFTMEVTR